MTVNPPKRGRPQSGNNKLSRDSIIATARYWLLHENRRLSIRALARQLDVDPMAIYHYFDNKAALLEAVTTTIMQNIYQPKENPNWRLELEKLCHSYLSLLKNNPGLLESLLSLGETAQGPAQVFTERFECAIAPLALKEDQKDTALNLLVDYLHGFVLAIHYAAGEKKPVIDNTKEVLSLYFQMLEVLAGEK